MKRRGLGRGLETLLPDPRPTGIGSGVRELPLDRLEPNPDQPRAEIPPADLESLAASIAAWGILEPIVVRPHPGRRAASRSSPGSGAGEPPGWPGWSGRR